MQQSKGINGRIVVVVLLWMLAGTAAWCALGCNAELLTLWWLGHLSLALALYKWNNVPHTSLIFAGFTALLLLPIVGLPYFLSHIEGWQGFLHLSDLTMLTWLKVLLLWIPALAWWLLLVAQMRRLHLVFPARTPRLAALVALASGIGFVLFAVGDVQRAVPVALSIMLLLLAMDLYMDTSKTSLTWLLLWLVMLSFFMGSLAFSESLKTDRITHLQLANSIVRLGFPDTLDAYHLPFQWDTLSNTTAQSRLSPALLQLEAGEGKHVRSENRMDWILRRPDGQGYVVVGRNTGGLRPPLTLISTLFIVGLVYTLLLRALAWLAKAPTDKVDLPLCGPPSLQLRIQVAFFSMALFTFLLIGFFTLHYFDTENEDLRIWLEQLLGVYAFLLLVAGALGIFLANSISEPIAEIGRKLGNTRLLNNEPLHWPKQDEIGRLVNNYNRMISELERSAAQMAAAEREGAWREMARQVAHEIKNPLTPMKLQLQQLQRLEKEAPEKARDWSKLVAERLIAQIDGLAVIADAFSNFARLPEARATTISLATLCANAVGLMQNENGSIQFSFINDAPDIKVFADQDQLLRVLNNLLRNAQQAIPPEQHGNVLLHLSRHHQQVSIAVTDNGTGIAPEVQARVFSPNFTTKSSGMGLGLAMCKQIVEQAGGTIAFQTELGAGTTFEILLPAYSTD